MKQRIPLDIYDIVPESQRAYLLNYGKHFNEKMYHFAVSQMRDKKGRRIKPLTQDEVEAKLKEQNVELENNVMYDAAFVYCMALSDFYGSSIDNDRHLCLYVKDLVDDPDQAEGFIFARFYADCITKGMPIDWAAML